MDHVKELGLFEEILQCDKISLRFHQTRTISSWLFQSWRNI